MRWLALIVITGLGGCIDPPANPPLDGGRADATVSDSDACRPSTEICNAADDDCDGRIDEGFDLDDDPLNCGACGVDCRALDHAAAFCDAGMCAISTCDEAFFDCDGRAENGCETQCVPTAEDEAPTCNGVDDDCDCAVDEGLGLDDDVENCGACGTICSAGFNATPGCSNGSCNIASCDERFFNVNGDTAYGCACELPNSPAQAVTINTTPAPAGVQVSYPGTGAVGVAMWPDPEDAEGLSVFARPLDAAGYWQGDATRVALERVAVPDLIGPISFASGAHGILWSNSGDLRLRLLGEAESQVIVDACGPERCRYTRFGETIIATTTEVEGVEPDEVVVVRTSTGQRLIEQAGNGGNLRVHALACRGAEDCAALFTVRDAESDERILYISARSERTELARSTSNITAFLEVVAGGFVAAWSQSGGERPPWSAAVLGLDGTINGNAQPLDLPANAASARLLRDGEGTLRLFWEVDGAASFVNIDANARQVGEPTAFALLPDGASAPGTYHDAQTAAAAAVDSGPVVDGLPILSLETLSAAQHYGTLADDDAHLVVTAAAGVFDVRYPVAEDATPQHLLTARGGARAPIAARTEAGLFALDLEAERGRWAVRRPDGSVERQPVILPLLERFDAEMMPWGAGVVLAIVGRAAEGATHHIGLVTAADALPMNLEFSAPQAGRTSEATPRMAGPGAGRGALLITNQIGEDTATSLLLRSIDAQGAAGAPSAVAVLRVPGLHAVTWSARSDRTFVFLADDIGEGDRDCPRALGVQLFDGALSPMGAPLESLDLRDRLVEFTELSDTCVRAISAAPNESGGATVVLREDGGNAVWLVNYNADGQRMGEPTRWRIGIESPLSLWPRPFGAWGVWRNAQSVREALFGCAPQ